MDLTAILGHHLRLRQILDRIVAPLDVDIRLQSSHQPLRRSFAEDDHIVNAFQSRQYLCPILLRHKGTSWSFDASCGFIAIHTHDQQITLLSGLFQTTHMPYMQEIETAVGEHHLPAPGCELFPQGAHLLHGYDFTSHAILSSPAGLMLFYNRYGLSSSPNIGFQALEHGIMKV